MPALVWTAPAVRDLRAIDAWLSEHRSPEFALRRLATLRERADVLTRFPHVGRPAGEGIRILRVYEPPYILLYRLQGEKLEILRIRHEREDWLVAR